MIFFTNSEICHTSLGDIFTYKMPALTSWHFLYIWNKLFSRICCLSASWIGDAGAAASVLSIILESVSLNVPVKLKEDSNISAINIADNVQVLYLKVWSFVHHLFVWST
jgi:hypothetical protein